MWRCPSCRISAAGPARTLQDHHGSGIVIGPTVAYLDRAYLDARAHGWSREPVIEMLIPSTLDDSLAPPGQARREPVRAARGAAPAGGRSWDDAKEEFADLVIDTVGRHAPNFKASVLGRQVLSPLDLERRFGLIDGDIFHGQLSARPALQRAARARPCRLPHAAVRRFTCAAPAPTPAAASQGCPGATRPLKSFAISDAVHGWAVR